MDTYDYLFVFLYVIPCLVSAFGIQKVLSWKSDLRSLIESGSVRMEKEDGSEGTKEESEDMFDQFIEFLERFKTYICVIPLLNWAIPAIIFSIYFSKLVK